MDAEGELQDSLRNVGEIDVYVSGLFVAFPGFGRFPAYAAGGDRIYTGWNAEYRITARSLAGDPMTVVSVSDLERTVDPAEMTPVRAEWMQRCPSPELCTPIVKMFEAYELPERRPAFAALEVDDRGDLWVAEYDPRGNMWYDHQGAGWHVFSPEGELLGRVAVPPGLVVTEVGADYVLGVQRNELGVPFVRRFPFTRSD